MPAKCSRSLKKVKSRCFNVYFFSPYSVQRNLGQALNAYMDLVPSDEDWVCFFDRDVLFLTADYGHQITEIIMRHPEAGLFTCLTNRIGCTSQLYRGKISNDTDILRHRKIALTLERKYRRRVEKISAPVSGFFMVLKKRVWREVRFDEGVRLLGVDWSFSSRLAATGRPIFLMLGLYVFHYYRLDTGSADIAHLTG